MSLVEELFGQFSSLKRVALARDVVPVCSTYPITQELYLAAENRTLRAHLPKLTRDKRSTLDEIGRRLGRKGQAGFPPRGGKPA